MDPTTLVTFLFRAPPEARAIELLGSWDNFTQPYRMHHDRRRGQGSWSGCFKFHNIIFDGDKPSWNKPRSGGLKQGGTYWYYYRLDDDIEAYDDSKEYTNACPLLPGQMVNVIEIPTELPELPVRSRSASVDALTTVISQTSTHTLEPGDKFAALDPPPISKVHARCRSELGLNARSDSDSDSYSLPSRADSQSINADLESLPNPLTAGQRCYASPELVDRQSSVYSRESWSSAALSLAHSSVIDAFEVDPFTGFEDSLSPMSPGLLNPPMPSRAPPPVPVEESGIMEGDAFREWVEYEEVDDTEDIPFQELSLSAEHGIPMPSRSPPAIPVAATAEETFNDVHDTHFLLPQSSSLHSTGEAQPQLSPILPSAQSQLSLPAPLLQPLRLDIHPLHTFSSIPYSNDRPTSSHGLATDRILQTHLALSLSPNVDADEEDDIWSPTFSAATVSSRGGGANTPFRVSLGQFRGAATFADLDGEATAVHHVDELDGVAERLRSLVTSSAELLNSSESEKAKVNEEVILPPAADLLPQLSTTATMQQPRPSSFIDSIFGELDFLRESIA